MERVITTHQSTITSNGGSGTDYKLFRFSSFFAYRSEHIDIGRDLNNILTGQIGNTFLQGNLSDSRLEIGASDAVKSDSQVYNNSEIFIKIGTCSVPISANYLALRLILLMRGRLALLLLHHDPDLQIYPIQEQYAESLLSNEGALQKSSTSNLNLGFSTVSQELYLRQIDEPDMANHNNTSGNPLALSKDSLQPIQNQSSIFQPTGFPMSGVSAVMTGKRNLKSSWLPAPSHDTKEDRGDGWRYGGSRQSGMTSSHRPPPPRPKASSHDRSLSEGLGLSSKLHMLRLGDDRKHSLARILHPREPVESLSRTIPLITHLRSSSEPLHTEVFEENRADRPRFNTLHLEVDKELIKSELKSFYSVRNDLVEQLNSLQWRFDSETSRFHDLKTELEQLEREKADLIETLASLRRQNRQLTTNMANRNVYSRARPNNDSLLFWGSDSNPLLDSFNTRTARSIPSKHARGALLLQQQQYSGHSGDVSPNQMRDRCSLDTVNNNPRLGFWRRIKSGGSYANGMSYANQGSNSHSNSVAPKISSPIKPPKVEPYPSRPGPTLRGHAPARPRRWESTFEEEKKHNLDESSLDSLDPLSSSYYTGPTSS